MTTTETITVTEFLLDRIAEDARRVDDIPEWRPVDSARGPGWGEIDDCWCGAMFFNGLETVCEEAAWEHMERVHRRTQVLADLEAKHRIIEWHRNWPVLVESEPEVDFNVKDGTLDATTLRMSKRIAWLTDQAYRDHFGTEPPTGPIIAIMAAAYSSHPDYDESWRPSA